MSIYDLDLDKNAANYQPLTPLSFLARSAAVTKETVRCVIRVGLLATAVTRPVR